MKTKRLSTADRHQLRIARQTLRMNDVGVKVMGGMSKEEALEVIRRLGSTSRAWLGPSDTCREVGL